MLNIHEKFFNDFIEIQKKTQKEKANPIKIKFDDYTLQNYLACFEFGGLTNSSSKSKSNSSSDDNKNNTIESANTKDDEIKILLKHDLNSKEKFKLGT